MRLKEILTLFVSSVNLLRYEHLRGLPKLTIDLPLAGLAELCSIWRGRTPGPFVLHHDRSTQLASDRKILKTPLSRDIPPKESSAGDRHAIFPVNVQRTVFVDSVLEKQVQLCDVVAGECAGTVACARRSDLHEHAPSPWGERGVKVSGSARRW